MTPMEKFNPNTLYGFRLVEYHIPSAQLEIILGIFIQETDFEKDTIGRLI